MLVSKLTAAHDAQAQVCLRFQIRHNGTEKRRSKCRVGGLSAIYLIKPREESPVAIGDSSKPDYGVDAPNVLRNLLLIGIVVLLIGTFGLAISTLGRSISSLGRCFRTGTLLVLEGLLFALLRKIREIPSSRSDAFAVPVARGRRSLDVGCGRGLRSAGAAKRLAGLNGIGKVTGIDIWSNTDMGGNSEAATRHNLELEGISDRCTLLGIPVQEMTFPDGASTSSSRTCACTTSTTARCAARLCSRLFAC